MPSQIKAVFEALCGEVVFDKKLVTAVHRFQTNFVTKNKDHIEFFGGNLTGVQVVRFLDADKNRWFQDILANADEEELREPLHVIPALSNDNGVFKVAGDPMNLSCAWLLHRLHNNTKLSTVERREAMIDVLLAMQFKFLTSRLYRLFRWPADEATAKATYAQLSNKFSIKVHGSWLAVLKARAEDVISNTSIHFDAIAKMDDDREVVMMINDIQGRIRDMLKNIYGVYLQVKAAGTKITSTSSVIEHDGVEVLKDRTKGLTTYPRYLKSVISDRNSFVREELINVVANVMPSAAPKYIRSSLEYLSANYMRSSGDIEKLVDACLIHSFSYLADNRASLRGNVDLAALLTRLRGVYTSSRSSDPDLLFLREAMEMQVRRAIDTKTNSVVASVRTGVLLYLVARAYTMNHYTHQ